MYVKRTTSPVNLHRVIRTARFAEMTRAFPQHDLAEHLGVSSEQASRVAQEAARIGLLEFDDGTYSATPVCPRFMQLIKKAGCDGLHEILMRHPAYAFFMTHLASSSPVFTDEWMDRVQTGTIPVTRAELDMVCSWAVAIGTIQQNYFTGQYYPVSGLRTRFVPTFMKVYHLLELPGNPSDPKKPVRIRLLREFVCQRLMIGRRDFDLLLTGMCEHLPENFILFRRVGNHSLKRARGCLIDFPTAHFCDGIEVYGRMYRSILCRDGDSI